MTNRQKYKNYRLPAFFKNTRAFPQKIAAVLDGERGAARQRCAGLIIFFAAMFAASIFFNFAAARASVAVDGELDTTFDGDGRATVSITTGRDIAQDIAVQADGKIVVVGGGVLASTSPNPVAVRLNGDGSLDTGFANGGRFGTPSLIGGYATCAAIQADGKIVFYVDGGFQMPSGAFAQYPVIRLNADGTLDTTFGSGGVFETNTFNIFGNGVGDSDIVIQPDGKIVVVGRTSVGSGSAFAVVRLMPNGGFDTTFDTDGRAITDFPPNPSGGGVETVYSVELQPDGKIVVGGGVAGFTFSGDSSTLFGVARFNSDGSPDTTFDTDGQATVSFNTAFASAEGSAIQPDGKIVLAGRAGSGNSNYNAAVARLLPDGSPDAAFDADGQTITAVPGSGNNALTDVHARGGKIVATGWRLPPSGTNGAFVIAQYNDDGSLDTTLDGDGFVLTEFTTGDDRSVASVFQADGKLLLAGIANPSATVGDFAVARYLFSLAPTAATVSVSGRVTAGRRGISRAVVYMTDQAGNTRTTRTDKLGFYRFEEVAAGQTYIFNAYSKLYQFNSQVVTINEDLEELNFTAQRYQLSVIGYQLLIVLINCH